MKRSLTKLPYLKLVATIAESEVPLSSHQIVEKMIKKRWLEPPSKKDVFRRLKKLVPRNYVFDKSTFLFNWDDLSSDDEKRAFLRKMNNLFELDWVIDFTDHTITFTKLERNGISFLGVVYDGHSAALAAVPSNPTRRNHESQLSLYKSKNQIMEKEVITKTNGGKLGVYLKKKERDQTRFLDVTLSEKIRSKHQLLHKHWEYIKDKKIHSLFVNNIIPDKVAEDLLGDDICMNLIYSSTFWKYEINFRGFLLYILAEAMAERKNSKRFQHVVFSKSIIKVVPFLLGHESLEALEFDTLKTLREIALEFQYQLDYTYQPQYLVTEKDEYLIYKVIESYKAKVDGFFNFMTEQVREFILTTKIEYINYASKRHKVIEYRLFMLDLLRTWTEKQSKKIADEYEHFQGEYNRYPVA
jgi:hypothetical protein